MAEETNVSGNDSQQTNQQTQAQQQSPQIDYTKIQQMLDGTLAAKEDTALKAYFKQQGLSQDEATQAISAYKEQKAAQTPDVGAIQQQLTQAQAAAQQAAIEKQATLEAIGLGVDVKTVPYLLKMADLSKVTAEDGSINSETLQAAINKVLEDVPALKPEKQENKGFQQIGASGGQQQTNKNDELAAIFGNTKG